VKRGFGEIIAILVIVILVVVVVTATAIRFNWINIVGDDIDDQDDTNQLVTIVCVDEIDDDNLNYVERWTITHLNQQVKFLAEEIVITPKTEEGIVTADFFRDSVNNRALQLGTVEGISIADTSNNESYNIRFLYDLSRVNIGNINQTLNEETAIAINAEFNQNVLVLKNQVIGLGYVCNQ
jgi:hypothetical protein